MKGENVCMANETEIGTSEIYMLTTADNPFNPFTQFEQWYLFDVDQGYNSSAYLARIAKIDDSMSEPEQKEEIERAIDEIVKYDFMNIYRKVSSKDY